MTALDRLRGCLLGLACGDALGASVKLRPPGSFSPLVDMVGGGPFHLAPGQWTDDTSMALCLASSLVAQRCFDPLDQMQRYCKWEDEGYLSSTGYSFDAGGTFSSALKSFRRTGDPFSGSPEGAACNGGIVRLAPVPMFFHRSPVTAVEMSAESARTTHGARESLDGAMLFGSMLCKAFAGLPKEEILFGPHLPPGCDVELCDSVLAVARGTYRDQLEGAFRGSSYVVKSLEAALWCFYRCESYVDAVLAAANLGDNADSTAAICGQIAGAHYGESGIPLSWRRTLAMRELIEALADKLHVGGK